MASRENSLVRSVHFEHVLMNDGWEPKSETGLEREGFLYKISIEVFMLARFRIPERKYTQAEWREMQKIKGICRVLFHMPVLRLCMPSLCC